MYPLDRGMWGPTVRIAHLRDELARLVDLDVVAGYRPQRRLATVRYALSGRLRGLDGIYVESSSFLPAESDLLFLALARSLGVPVVSYVRDAYQLFPDYHRPDTLRRRAGDVLFRPAVRALGAASSQLAFPTRGLATAILGEVRGSHSPLLPPGAPPPVMVPPKPGANRLLFVGDARLAAQGADRLIAGAGLARERGAQVELAFVAREGQEPPPPHPAWLHLHRAEGAGIHAILPDVMATVIPRPRGAYNDLSLPIKLFDYLSYGRPLLVTDCAEQARIVREADAGLVVDDDPPALAAGIERLLHDGEARSRWSENAHRAAEHASWASRAGRVLELLGIGA